jgi:hypothetical protein
MKIISTGVNLNPEDVIRQYKVLKKIKSTLGWCQVVVEFLLDNSPDVIRLNSVACHKIELGSELLCEQQDCIALFQIRSSLYNH